MTICSTHRQKIEVPGKCVSYGGQTRRLFASFFCSNAINRCPSHGSFNSFLCCIFVHDAGDFAGGNSPHL